MPHQPLTSTPLSSRGAGRPGVRQSQRAAVPHRSGVHLGHARSELAPSPCRQASWSTAIRTGDETGVRGRRSAAPGRGGRVFLERLAESRGEASGFRWRGPRRIAYGRRLATGHPGRRVVEVFEGAAGRPSCGRTSGRRFAPPWTPGWPRPDRAAAHAPAKAAGQALATNDGCPGRPTGYLTSVASVSWCSAISERSTARSHPCWRSRPSSRRRRSHPPGIVSDSA